MAYLSPGVCSSCVMKGQYIGKTILECGLNMVFSANLVSKV